MADHDSITPRPYQAEAAEAAARSLQGHDSALLVAATGVGKTTIAGLVLRDWPDDKRVLVLVNRVELLKQFRDTLRGMLDAVIEIESEDSYAAHVGNSLFPEHVGRVVVASKDTLCQWKRLRRYRKDEFSLIVVDEAHHVAPTNVSYVRILDYFEGYKLLGLTATPDRMDGLAMSSYFQTVAYQYEAYNAIKDSWLVPVRQQVETVTGWDLSRCGRSANGDYNLAALDEAMREERPAQALATAAVRYANEGGEKRPCLVFTVSVDHAELTADVINRYVPGSAVALCGDDRPDVRRDQLARYSRGEFQYLVGCSLFCEGFDEPRVSVVVIGRPTLSRVLYAQMVGRGMRPWPTIVPALNAAGSAEERADIIRSSPKPSLLVVDMVGVSDVHKLRPMTTADILGGWYTQKVRDEAALAMAEQPARRWSPEEAIHEARRRLDAKERERRRRLIMRAELESREVDPFVWFDVRPQRKMALRRGRMATPRQLEYLAKNDMPPQKFLSRSAARVLIDELMKRKNAEPPSQKQAAVLAKYGFPVDRMTFKEAKEAIDLISDVWKSGGT